MKKRFSFLLLAAALVGAAPRNASATVTWLPLRCGCAMPLHAGLTVRTLSTNFGTNLATLAFSGTTTYDFYSPPLSEAVALTTTDKGGGTICMQNTGTTDANNFSVSGRMQYFDYNPATGTEVSIVDTGASSPKNVNYGQTVNWSTANVALPSAITLPVGHMIHVAMTITQVPGNSSVSGLVLYNGPSGESTAALFPQNRAVPVNWTFNSSAMYGSPATIVSIAPQPDGTMLISCAGMPATAYALQATTSLSSPAWAAFANTTSDSNGLFSFIHSDATNYPCCFYRTATQ